MITTPNKRTLAQATADAEAFRAIFPSKDNPEYPFESYRSWTIAGSIRRERPYVGDVEHIVEPLVGDEPGGMADLFNQRELVNLVWHHADKLVSTYTITMHQYGGVPKPDGSVTPKGPRWGERFRGIDWRGFRHEIYLADEHNRGAQLAIRTGPGGFSKMLVTRLQANGYMNQDGYVWNKNAMYCSACGWNGRFADLMFVAGDQWLRHINGDQDAYAKPRWVNGHDRGGLCPDCRRQTTLAAARVSVPDEKEYFRLCGVPWTEPPSRFDPPPQGGTR